MCATGNGWRVFKDNFRARLLKSLFRQYRSSFQQKKRPAALSPSRRVSRVRSLTYVVTGATGLVFDASLFFNLCGKPARALPFASGLPCIDNCEVVEPVRLALVVGVHRDALVEHDAELRT